MASTKRRRSVSGRPAFWVATHHSPTEIAIVTTSFVRARRPERAALDDLRVVVGEAEQRAGDRRAEHADRAPVVVGEDQERHRDRREDDDPAHRRRARLVVVALGALLADVLAELAVAQGAR